MRAARSVVVLDGRINAEMGVRRGEDVLHDFGIVLRFGGMLIGSADDSAPFHSATGD